MEVQQLQTPAITCDATHRLRAVRVLLAGLGNIGSFVAVLIAPLVALVRLVDRDTVELHNTINQLYSPEHVGHAKVDVAAQRLERLVPHLHVERRVADLEDLAWGEYTDIDVVLAGLDSLRARQILSEKLYPLRIPLIDGAVGEPQLVRVQTLLQGQACLECSWSRAHYRQLATEYPCQPGASPEAPPTLAPGCAGAATAALMVAQCIRLFGDDPPRESYEIHGDLVAGRFVTARRRRNNRCRFPHETGPQLVALQKPFADATLGDLVATVQQEFGQQTVQLEFRRGVLDGDLFGAGRFAVPEQLHRMRHRRLDHVGLTPKDRVVVRASGRARTAHICFDAPNGRVS